MEFDKSKVYTALNADERLIGAKGYFADTLDNLKYNITHQVRLMKIKCINKGFIDSENSVGYNFFYLVEPAPKWYVYEDESSLDCEVYGINSNHVTPLFTGTKEECEQYILEHSKSKYRPFKDCDELIKAYCDLVQKKCDLYREEDYSKNILSLPTIWVRNNKRRIAHLITDYDLDMNSLNCIKINGDWEDLEFLFKYCRFLDGSVCGVEE